jgi:hypothetical protein
MSGLEDCAYSCMHELAFSRADFSIWQELGSMITVVGDRIRVMKEDGASKDVFGESVDELLALKARYQEIAGTPWTPPVKA